MRIIHQQWQITGQVLVIDDEDNAVIVGKDDKGNDAKIATIIIGVSGFRGNKFEEAYQRARAECDALLLRLSKEQGSKGEDPPAGA